MALKVEIDPFSGFCGGVIRAIGTAERYLNDYPEKGLFSLGSIVHNEEELERLSAFGLVALDYDDFNAIDSAGGKALLIRAHGEPPSTYEKAKAKGFDVIDCTCPVVLQLQKEIKAAYDRQKEEPVPGQILIFGKTGHAEVLGLLGQVNGDAVVVEDCAMFDKMVEEGKIDCNVPVEIFSQTTKSPSEYADLCEHINCRIKYELLVHNTICLQVASRYQRLTDFAMGHDVIVFVSGKTSSNGAVLCNICKSVNIRTYHVGSTKDIRSDWFAENDTVGICGATSTPKWLLDKVALYIENFAR